MIPRRFLKFALRASLAILVGLASYLWAIQASGNFATVVAGEVYRSNQVTPDRMRAYRDQHGIRTILNLRGPNPNADWYKLEVEAARSLGIRLIDFGLSAQHELTDAELADLTVILKNAPKPLLIHCRSCADRTGLASVIYQAVISGIEEDRAEQQLSLRFGHFSVPLLSQAWPMDQTWERAERLYGID